MPGADLQVPPPWEGPSEDPRDEQFGDIVASVSADRADQYAAVLVGEPYDGAVIGERGAAKGPVGLRQALAATKTHHFAAGPIRSVADLGDVTVPDGSPSGVQRHVRETARAVHETSAFPVFLGGDNSLSFANAAPLLAEGSLGVVNLDAHLDCRAVRDEPTSGTPYRQLYEAGMDDYAVVGARHFETSTAYAEYVADRDGTVVTADEVGTGPTAAAERAREAVADADVVYLSVDLDVLDASVAPGVSAPTPGGLTARELYRLLDALATDDRLAGFEVMECAPPLDRDRRTAKAGARAVARVLSARLGKGDDD